MTGGGASTQFVGGALGVLVILFAETGILLGIVLPGDSLLFTAGLLSATTRKGDVHLNLPVVLVAAVVGAMLGAQTGYLLGRKLGPRLFRRPDSRLFKQEYVERTREYLEKYGPARAVILARFVPVVRTLMNPLVGVAEIDAKVFAVSNVVGGVAWGAGVTIAGYFLGKSIPNVDHYLLPIIAVIVAVSLDPRRPGDPKGQGGKAQPQRSRSPAERRTPGPGAERSGVGRAVRLGQARARVRFGGLNLRCRDNRDSAHLKRLPALMSAEGTLRRRGGGGEGHVDVGPVGAVVGEQAGVQRRPRRQGREGAEAALAGRERAGVEDVGAALGGAHGEPVVGGPRHLGPGEGPV